MHKQILNGSDDFDQGVSEPCAHYIDKFLLNSRWESASAAIESNAIRKSGQQIMLKPFKLEWHFQLSALPKVPRWNIRLLEMPSCLTVINLTWFVDSLQCAWTHVCCYHASQEGTCGSNRRTDGASPAALTKMWKKHRLPVFRPVQTDWVSSTTIVMGAVKHTCARPVLSHPQTAEAVCLSRQLSHLQRSSRHHWRLWKELSEHFCKSHQPAMSPAEVLQQATGHMIPQ